MASRKDFAEVTTPRDQWQIQLENHGRPSLKFLEVGVTPVSLLI